MRHLSLLFLFSKYQCMCSTLSVSSHIQDAVVVLLSDANPSRDVAAGIRPSSPNVIIPSGKNDGIPSLSPGNQVCAESAFLRDVARSVVVHSTVRDTKPVSESEFDSSPGLLLRFRQVLCKPRCSWLLSRTVQCHTACMVRI